MNLFKIKKNKGSASSSSSRTEAGQDGFTIVEAMVAIFILTVSVSSMLGITASSSASARYANNEIAANYLLQEAIDSIRNSRDTIAFQMKDSGGGWDKFLEKYGGPFNKCFGTNGCDLMIEDFDPTGIDNDDVMGCGSTGCEYLNYDDNATSFFYNHSGYGIDSGFRRTVNMEKTSNPDEIKVTAKVEWLNGNATTLRTQTLIVYLLNWQKD